MRYIAAVSVCVLIISGMVIVGVVKIVARVTNQSIESHHSPFAEFASLMPGKPAENAAEFQCSYSQVYATPAVNSSRCLYLPEDHPYIGWVFVTMKDGIIDQTEFRVRLQYGDLVSWFGRAQHEQQFGDRVLFGWHGIYAAGTTQNIHTISLFTPVRQVTFHTHISVE